MHEVLDTRSALGSVTAFGLALTGLLGLLLLWVGMPETWQTGETPC